MAVAVGLAAGAFAGLMGVGGGILMVPALVILLDQSQHVAQGTSLVVIVATAAAGTLANARRGFVERRSAALLAAGGVAGSVFGALLALRVLDETVLRRIFGAFVIVVALRMLVGRPEEEGQ